MTTSTTAAERILDGRVSDPAHAFAGETRGELAGRLAEHVVAGALVRKSVDDPVPFPVWWRVSDALRAAVVDSPAAAAAEVEAAMRALEVAVETVGRAPSGPPVGGERPASVELAEMLVARLVFATSATSPTLLHVRLARLRRALLAAV